MMTQPFTYELNEHISHLLIEGFISSELDMKYITNDVYLNTSLSKVGKICKAINDQIHEIKRDIDPEFSDSAKELKHDFTSALVQAVFNTRNDGREKEIDLEDFYLYQQLIEFKKVLSIINSDADQKTKILALSKFENSDYA